MEITVKFRQGPLDVEFQAEDRESLEKELTAFVEFLDENSSAFVGLSAPERAETGEGTQTGVTDWDTGTQDTGAKSVDDGGSGGYTEAQSQLAKRIRVDVSDLVQVVGVPENEDDRPHIKTWQFDDGLETLGSSRKDRQAKASLILLYLWMETTGTEGVTLETLKRALSDSDIDPARIDTMYTALDGNAEKYIDKPGGRGGKISLNPDGEHQARQELRELVERLS